MKKIEGKQQLVLNAKKKIYINTFLVDGERPTSNGNAKVLFDCEDLVVKNTEIADGCIAYNVFEQRGTTQFNLKTIKGENIACDDVSLKHNIFSVYNLADDATILIQDSSFNLDVNNSNIIRLANYKNAKNVTVHFKNIDWTYENALEGDKDFSWAGLVIYQPASGDAALNGDISNIKTWKFIFENCRYNGVKVTENNTGEHSQVMYLYNVNKANAIESPDVYNLDVEFI